MGHERVGTLPRSKRWRDIVAGMSEWGSGDLSVDRIASDTLANVRSRYARMHKDEGVIAAFRFLVTLTTAARDDEPYGALETEGIGLPPGTTLLGLTRALGRYMSQTEGSLEYRQIALSSAAETMAAWTRQTAPAHRPLFGPEEDPLGPWRKAATGRGFCRVARLFFSAYTRRYLEYFLDRAAPAAFADLQSCDRFRDAIREHVDVTARHTFETAKITESFAAGWYNKHAKDRPPTTRETEAFLRLAFGKLREELRREAAGQ